MHDLEVLDGIFDIDNTAWAMFQVYRASFHQLFQLLSAKTERGTGIPGLAAVDIAVPMGFHPFAESRVAGDMA